MNTLVVTGRSIEVAAPSGGLESGQPYLVGKLVGISANKYKEGETAVISLVGAHDVPKATGAVWNQGDILYWDDSAKNFTKTSSANTQAGYAFVGAGSSAAVGQILLRQ